MENLNPFVTLIIALIGAVAGGLLTLFVKGKKGVKEEIDRIVPDEWHWALENGARIAVKAAEQLFDEEANGDKLDWAIKYVFDYMDKVGLALNESDRLLIQGAIEKAVYDLKQEWHKLPDEI
jgi:hypothetical protein